MRAVVIGGNGFIGSHIVDSLASRGVEVTVFDRFSSPMTRFASKDVRRVAGDFLNPRDVAAAVRGQDSVLHFLSTTTPATASSDPTADIRTNISASVSLFQAAEDAGVSKVYFASTGGAIYGSDAPRRCKETDPTTPVSPYAIGKRAIESYLDFFSTRGAFESVSLRISNPYGTRQPPGRKQGLIPIALQNIIAGRPVTMFGDGSMVRDYILVNDVAEMVAKLVNGSARERLYNVGSGVGHSVSDVLDTISEVTKQKLVIREVPTPPTFIDHVVLDVDRYAKEFGSPQLTSLRSGIAATWQSLVGESRG